MTSSAQCSVHVLRMREVKETAKRRFEPWPLALRVSVLLTVLTVLRHGPLVKSSILRRDFPENTFCCGFLGNKEEL